MLYNITLIINILIEINKKSSLLLIETYVINTNKYNTTKFTKFCYNFKKT